MDGKTKKITKKVLLYVLLIVLALIWIVPIFTLVATALKHKKDFMSGLSLFQLPAEIAWDNFTNAITKGNLFTYMKNDLIISCLKVPLGIFVGAMASFALTRLNIKHRVGIFVFFLIGMMLPAIATLFITDFLSTWNEYLLASVIINDKSMKTVPVGIMTFVGEHGTDYGYLCAGVLVSVIPVMVVYLIFQRYFVEGMAGAVKS